MNQQRLWPKHPKDVLVDFVEGELDKEFESDLETWLKSSEGAQSNIKVELETLSQLRQSLKDSEKDSDVVLLPESGSYFEALGARIVGALDHAIETGEVRDRAQDRLQQLSQSSAKGILPELLERAYALNRSQAPPRGIAARAGHFAVLAGLALLMTGKWPQQIGGVQIDGAFSKDRNMSFKREVLDATREAVPAVLAETIVSLEAASDLSMDLVARENVQRMLASNSHKSKGD